MPRMSYMTWEVAAAAFVEHDRSSLSPVDVADELAVQLTHRGYFDGRRRFSLGVRALAEGAARLAEEPEDHIAQMNYMQCGGSAERMTIEVRVASGESMTHYAVSRMPVADDNAWIELPYEGIAVFVFTPRRFSPASRRCRSSAPTSLTACFRPRTFCATCT